MKLAVAIVGTMAVCASGVTWSRSTLAAQEQQSQWDGIYTVEQAARGESLFADKCSSCHGPDMNGGEMAPGLVGSSFTSNWNDLTLGDLFDRIRVSMPQNDPGSLSRQENADILAFILRKGSYPAGEAELPTRTEVLGMYKFMAVKPEK